MYVNEASGRCADCGAYVAPGAGSEDWWCDKRHTEQRGSVTVPLGGGSRESGGEETFAWRRQVWCLQCRPWENEKPAPEPRELTDAERAAWRAWFDGFYRGEVRDAPW